MQEILEIEINPYEPLRYEVYPFYKDGKFILRITVPQVESLELLLDNQKQIENDLSYHLDFLYEDWINTNPKLIEITQNIINHNFNIKNFANEVYFLGSYNHIQEFIARNIILQNKKIILKKQISLNKEIINKLVKLFDKDNVYIYLDNNSDAVSLDACLNTMKAIFNITDFIKSFNLSVFEQIMLAFDIVRKREFMKENADEDYKTSRDLTSILFGDKIVCLGYANFLDSILKVLNIKSLIVYYTKMGGVQGHARNLVFIDDNKYNIKGLYYIDATWNSKKKTNDYLNNYRFFANTKSQMDKYDNNCYLNITLPDLYEDFSYDFERILTQKGVKGLSIDMIKTINTLSALVDNKVYMQSIYLFPGFDVSNLNWEDYIDSVYYYEDLLSRPIRAHQYLAALYNIRKIEYYYNPQTYPFSKDSLFETYLNSDWVFNMNGEYNILEAMFGIVKVDKYTQEEKFNDFINSSDIEKNIELVKLTKTLKNTINKKNN